MEEKSSERSLTFSHIRNAGKEILDYIDQRRKGLATSLKTRWEKFNRATMGGLDWNVIMTIAGMSGSGKSSIANDLETSLFDCNPDENFSVLSFNFEMLAMKQVGRKLSHKLYKTVGELYSSNEDLNDDMYERAENVVNSISNKYSIYYVDIPGTVEEMYNTVKVFHDMRKEKTQDDEYGTIVMIDHTLLTRHRAGDSERESLVKLYRMMMLLKKELKCTFIVISQLNREIEKSERLTNPMQQYPMKKDIFGSDSVFHGSDYVLITHKPYMLNMQTYGPHHLPVVNPDKDSQAMIYWHILKNRDGESGVVMQMTDMLKYNRVDEYVKKEDNKQLEIK